MRKHSYNISEFIRQYGRGITKEFVRKDGKHIRISFSKPNLRPRVNNFMGSVPTDPFSFLNRELRTINAFGQPCASCGSKKDIEMHHLRHIKSINLKLNPFDSLMAKINRKQIPLCAKCHKEVHQGKYSGKSLKALLKPGSEETK